MTAVENSSQRAYVESHPDFAVHPTTRFTDRREPYVRASVQRTDGDTETVDAKVTFWTATHANIRWQANDAAYDFWVRAETVTRIPRRDSIWKDVYDHADGYPEGEY
ncbi:hypothetical protein CVV68_01615 [Arthrobacter livingstonensis]|uniref:Uncharacterized protein n=1 Tax=Arthrobacter livingstonensis TaxID=670078 RepID=A0A2V5LDX2_9MICC|nr:hypothetical protein CVV68_01615 [Arthrobacter livingstonensis]